MPQAKGVRTLFRRPTLLSAGVGTVSRFDPKDRLGFPDPTQWNYFFDDFTGQTTALTSGAANGWAQVGGVGTPLGVQIPDAGSPLGTSGLFKLTTSAGGTDSTTMQRHATLGQNFTFDSTRKFYMETRFALDSATLSDVGFGMVPASTSSLLTAQTDGSRIGKTTGVGTFNFQTFAASGTAKTITLTLWNSALMPLNTMVTLGMAYVGVAYGPGSFGPVSGNATPLTAVNFEFVVYADLNDGSGIRQQAIIMPSTSFSANTVGLMPSFSTLNTSGVARNMTIDYVMVAQERFNA